MDEVLKNGPSEICQRQPLKVLKWYGLLKLIKFFKGCLPQIPLGPFLNTLSQLILEDCFNIFTAGFNNFCSLGDIYGGVFKTPSNNYENIKRL